MEQTTNRTMNRTEWRVPGYSGQCGEELVVLSTPEIRAAERSTERKTIETADGPVDARPGDFIVSMPNGERFPISAGVYFGTYEVLSSVGNWFIGRRLIHRRRVWPVTSSAAEFDYGSDRGSVAIDRGSWLYQSDESDYGVINATAAVTSHTLVCQESALKHADWVRAVRWTDNVLGMLPVLLIALGVIALGVQANSPNVALWLLASEGALLVAGVLLAWRSRSGRWHLRAAVEGGAALAREFQTVVAALGQRQSEAFPMMALWRAAQADSGSTQPPQQTSLSAIKERLNATIDRLTSDLHRHHKLERSVEKLSWIAAAVVLAALAAAATTHQSGYKLLAIWLPSVVGACHAWLWQRQIRERADSERELISTLQFARNRLMALTREARSAEEKSTAQTELIETLRFLCRCIASHTQRELKLHVSSETPVPV